MRYIKITSTILNITRIWEERSASAPYTKQWKLLLDIGESNGKELDCVGRRQ
jgi:hypothetical protein